MGDAHCRAASGTNDPQLVDLVQSFASLLSTGAAECWVAEVGHEVLIGRCEFVEPSLAVATLAPTDMCG
jgi:hypothetical protein